LTLYILTPPASKKRNTSQNSPPCRGKTKPKGLSRSLSSGYGGSGGRGCEKGDKDLVWESNRKRRPNEGSQKGDVTKKEINYFQRPAIYARIITYRGSPARRVPLGRRGISGRTSSNIKTILITTQASSQKQKRNFENIGKGRRAHQAREKAGISEEKLENIFSNLEEPIRIRPEGLEERKATASNGNLLKGEKKIL